MPALPEDVEVGHGAPETMLDKKRKEQIELAEQLYGELQQAGVEVCFDDRPMSPGAKFKDHELIGIPVQPEELTQPINKPPPAPAG